MIHIVYAVLMATASLMVLINTSMLVTFAMFYKHMWIDWRQKTAALNMIRDYLKNDQPAHARATAVQAMAYSKILVERCEATTKNRTMFKNWLKGQGLNVPEHKHNESKGPIPTGFPIE